MRVAEAAPSNPDWIRNFVVADAASYVDSFLGDRWNETAGRICWKTFHQMTSKSGLRDEKLGRDVRVSLRTGERAKMCHKSLEKRQKLG